MIDRREGHTMMRGWRIDQITKAVDDLVQSVHWDATDVPLTADQRQFIRWQIERMEGLLERRMADAAE